MDGKPFALKSTDQSFRERQKNVFDQISTLERSLPSANAPNPDEMQVDDPTRSPRQNRTNMRHFRGKESIFKRPREPPGRHYMRTMPDHKKNPHKWTKYTLDDVKDEDMSDRGNTRAAFSFLNELKRRRTAEEQRDEEMEADRPQKIVFKKSTAAKKQHTAESEQEAKSSFRSSKVVMPEYVVGQKKKKEKKNKETKSGEGRGLKLDHLFDEEED